MSDSLPFETYRPNAEPMTPDQYDYTIHSFTCPACNRGLQRPKSNLNLSFDCWIYWCEVCDSRGTRAEVKNGVQFAATLRRYDCKICGGHETRRPAADKMQYDWWMTRSREWIRRCDACGFVGTMLEFEVEAFRRSQGNQLPDIDMNKIDEIPY